MESTSTCSAAAVPRSSGVNRSAAPQRRSRSVVHRAGLQGQRQTLQMRAGAGAYDSVFVPNNSRQFEVLSNDPVGPIVSKGPSPPSPMTMDRMQTVLSQLFMQRIVRLGGAVDDDMANLIVAQLLYLDSLEPSKDITMYVNSPGGSVTAGMAVFDTMRHIRPDVSTLCGGLAASMGAFLLAAGQQGKRYALPNSRVMIHQPLGGAQGNVTDVEIQANEILHHKLILNGFLAEFTGQPIELVDRDTDRDFFLSAQESVEYGLVDAVISKPNPQYPYNVPVPQYLQGAEATA